MFSGAKRRIWCLALAVLCLGGRQTARSQTPASQPERPQPVLGLTLRDLPEFPGGKTSLLQGTVDPKGHRFVLENLDVLQPVSVTLVAAGPDQDLSLRLSKFGFDKAEREGSTLGEGVRRFQIRTQGDLRLLIRSKEGEKPYQLIVWVGDPITVPMPLLFTPAGAVGTQGIAGGPSAAASNTLLWAAIAILGVAVLVLGFLVLRSGAGRRVVALLLALGLGAAARADARTQTQATDTLNLKVARINPSEIWGKNPHAPGGYNPPPGPSGEKGWSPNPPVDSSVSASPAASSRTQSPKPVAAPGNPSPVPRSDPVESQSSPVWIITAVLAGLVLLLGAILIRRRRVAGTAVLLVLSTMAGESNAQKLPGVSWWGLPNTFNAGFEFAKAYMALTPSDEEGFPTFPPPGLPDIPTNCVTPIPPGVAKPIGATDDVGPCGACFSEAHKELGTVLERFEKLRRVTGATENMTKWALAFGDGASGVHGVTALGWHSQARPQIVAAMEAFYVSYDTKYEELTLALREALNKIGECEAKYFNYPDWYTRFGFMFYNTVAERHRR